MLLVLNQPNFFLLEYVYIVMRKYILIFAFVVVVFVENVVQYVSGRMSDVPHETEHPGFPYVCSVVFVFFIFNNCFESFA